MSDNDCNNVDDRFDFDRFDFLTILLNPTKMLHGRRVPPNDIQQFKDNSKKIADTNKIFQDSVNKMCSATTTETAVSLGNETDLQSTFNKAVRSILEQKPWKYDFRAIISTRPGRSGNPLTPINAWRSVALRLFNAITGSFSKACANIKNINNANLKCTITCAVGSLPFSKCNDDADTPGAGPTQNWNYALACEKDTVVAGRLQLASKYEIATNSKYLCGDSWNTRVDITNVTIFGDCNSTKDYMDNAGWPAHCIAGSEGSPHIFMVFGDLQCGSENDESNLCKGKWQVKMWTYAGDNLSIEIPAGDVDSTKRTHKKCPVELVLDKTITWSSYKEGYDKTLQLAKDVFEEQIKFETKIVDNAVTVIETSLKNINQFITNLKTSFSDVTSNPEFAKALTLEWLQEALAFDVQDLLDMRAKAALYSIWNIDREKNPGSYWATTAKEAECMIKLLETLQILSPDEEWPIGSSKVAVGNINDFLPEGCILLPSKNISCNGGAEIPLNTFINDPVLGRAIRDEAISKVQNQTPEGNPDKGEFKGPQCGTAYLIENGISLTLDNAGNLSGTVKYKFNPVQMWGQVAGVGEECNAENIHKLMQSLANALTATIPPGCTMSIFHNLIMGQTSSIVSEEFIGSPGIANPGELAKINGYCSYTFPNRQNNNQKGGDGKLQIMPDDCADYPQIFPQEKRYSLLITIWLISWAMSKYLNALTLDASKLKTIWLKYFDLKRFNTLEEVDVEIKPKPEPPAGVQP